MISRSGKISKDFGAAIDRMKIAFPMPAQPETAPAEAVPAEPDEPLSDEVIEKVPQTTPPEVQQLIDAKKLKEGRTNSEGDLAWDIIGTEMYITCEGWGKEHCNYVLAMQSDDTMTGRPNPNLNAVLNDAYSKSHNWEKVGTEWRPRQEIDVSKTPPAILDLMQRNLLRERKWRKETVWDVMAPDGKPTGLYIGREISYQGTHETYYLVQKSGDVVEKSPQVGSADEVGRLVNFAYKMLDLGEVQ